MKDYKMVGTETGRLSDQHENKSAKPGDIRNPPANPAMFSWPFEKEKK